LPEPGSLILAAIAAGLGAMVQGSVGFGYALVAAPLLTLIDPQLVPGAATIGSAGFALLSVRRTRGGPTDWDGVRWAGAGLVLGTLPAGLLLAMVSEHTVAVIIGILVLVAVLVSLTGLDIRRTPLRMLGLGVVSGFMGTAATVGGPPIALAYQHEPGVVIRATLTRIFVVGTVLTIAALVPAGRLGLDEAWAGLALLPGVAVGFGLSRRLHDVLDAGWARPAVLVLSAVSATVVLVRELL
jgi:uncharacterized membrane protein YfcA